MATIPKLEKQIKDLEGQLENLKGTIFQKSGLVKQSFLLDKALDRIPLGAIMNGFDSSPVSQRIKILDSKKISQYKLEDIGKIVGNHYQIKTLDCVIDAAYAVSKDFSQRPDSYKNVSVSAQLILFRRAMGNLLPDKMTRKGELYQPFFGGMIPNNTESSQNGFYSSAKSLMEACKAYSENKLESTTLSLSERVNIANQYFRSHIEGLFGRSQMAALFESKIMFELSRQILKDTEIQKLFGVNGTIPQDWPLESPPNSDGAILIQNIFTQLSSIMPQPSEIKLMNNFINKQLISKQGNESIINSLKDNVQGSDPKDPTSKINKLVASVYSWGSEMGMLS